MTTLTKEGFIAVAMLAGWKLSARAGSLIHSRSVFFPMFSNFRILFRMMFAGAFSLALFLGMLCQMGRAADAPASPVGQSQAGLGVQGVLPSQFAGWQVSGAVAKSNDPATADAANAAVLKEYGFQRLEKAKYTREDGRTLEVKAAVFEDASGAYGAFTFYRNQDMLEEKIGGQGSSLGNRVLFFQGNVLVDAVFDKVTAMSAAELRELAGLIPQVRGSAGKLPALRDYLPMRGFQKNSEKYVTGPATLDRMRAPLASATVDFKSDVEVMLAKYAAEAGDATLMLIEYPTPQIAAEKLRQIEAAHQVTVQQPGVASIVDVGPFFDKRTGPIVVIAAGPLSHREAEAMLSAISYDADVTWNENTYLDKKNNLANLLFNVIVLCGIVIGLALVVGIGFGGARILLKRIFPGKVFDRPDAMEIISLHLEEEVREVRERLREEVREVRGSR